MKDIIIRIITAILFISFCIIYGIIVRDSINSHKERNERNIRSVDAILNNDSRYRLLINAIDFPEKWPTISNDSSKPTKTTCYFSHDTLHLEFQH